jgi:hypothetical protein
MCWESAATTYIAYHRSVMKSHNDRNGNEKKRILENFRLFLLADHPELGDDSWVHDIHIGHVFEFLTQEALTPGVNPAITAAEHRDEEGPTAVELLQADGQDTLLGDVLAGDAPAPVNYRDRQPRGRKSRRSNVNSRGESTSRDACMSWKVDETKTRRVSVAMRQCHSGRALRSRTFSPIAFAARCPCR